jgi:hypothetical protein
MLDDLVQVHDGSTGGKVATTNPSFQGAAGFILDAGGRRQNGRHNDGTSLLLRGQRSKSSPGSSIGETVLILKGMRGGCLEYTLPGLNLLYSSYSV